ncbi:MAG: riboflavin biosynthesis protein RibF [Bacteroidales bacterium]|nr:riboflavin biosynthesis protein RibF [Bacteroidales bacterium]
MVVATGFFDGVHLGHRFVIARLVEAARERGEESMVVTFWPHPRNVLQDGARNLRLLTSLEEKKALLASLGVDHVEVIGFTKEFSQLSTEQYLRDVIKERLGGTAILLGYDNRMGRNPASPDEIQKIAESVGLDVIRTDSVSVPEGTVISSTQIRRLLSEGNVGDAARMLGYGYNIHGVVVAGNQLGRTIGFPTANMQLYEPLKLLPANGVYKVEVETLGSKFLGMCNIGNRPTVSNTSSVSIETNIFNFDEYIYGLDMRITFLRKIRDEIRFTDLGELKEQLKKDREEARK